ncbi:alpha/beta hydrolase [Peribacillus alkalitolerans]|uniref:alpha/beta hydrolase n=1 Tax=Peribacillus alkalitolerans TaxID=1550385 RepID=UPI0013D179B4|nr:alpha/beta hydrolase [Peribacillus alkalitolerans]
MRNIEVEIQSGVLLQGTLSFPEGKQDQYPVVLIMPGSGNSDRDGNNEQMKLVGNLYKKLAEEFATMGFASLRYDKRGAGKSGGNTLTTGFIDLMDDAEFAYQFLVEHPEVDPNNIFLFGHSEGSFICPAISLKHQVSGMILVAGGGETMESSATYQKQLAYKELVDNKGFLGWLVRTFKLVDKTIKKDQMIMAKIMDSERDTIRISGKKMPAKYIREAFGYDVQKDMEEVTCPVLALGGTKDLQTRAEKMENLRNWVKGDVVIHTIENMGHDLKIHEDEVKILTMVKSFKNKLQDPVAPLLLYRMEEWLTANKN